ncbi:hypothetical protein U9M48_018030 [Paspalum notatum var. saurae]|uniref:DUF1618 domain-containing protein n=1 Tax=Paspalum notatum var. saurae TaxID=547442 RepID=A0AAQ3WPE6_PASNO
MTDGQWVILTCIPRVAHCLAGTLLAVADLRTRLTASTPPRASWLTVHRFFAPDYKALDNYPYIASANRRGLHLCASQQLVDEPLTRLDGFIGKELGLDDEHANKAFFLFKRTTTGSGRHVFLLPKFPRMINPGNACLVDDGDKDDFYGLETTRFIRYVGLHYWSTGSINQWLYRNLTYPESLWFRPWGAHGTIYHNCKIWWVDLSCGLLYGNPHDMLHESGKLSFVALPDGCELPARTPHLDKKRCVGVSAGKLRYVQIHKLRGRKGILVPVVSMWTLIDEATGEWRRDCRTPWKWIWDNLEPDKLPAVALIHPNHGDVVYFFKQFWIVGVDVREGRVLEWQFNAMLHPPLPYHSSRFVRPWLVARELLDGT